MPIPLDGTVPVYPAQPYGYSMFPTLFPTNYMWPGPRYTLTPPNLNQFFPTTGVIGAGQNFGAGLYNLQGFGFGNLIGGVFAAISGIFNAVFGMPAFYPSPWVGM